MDDNRELFHKIFKEDPQSEELVRIVCENDIDDTVYAVFADDGRLAAVTEIYLASDYESPYGWAWDYAALFPNDDGTWELDDGGVFWGYADPDEVIDDFIGTEYKDRRKVNGMISIWDDVVVSNMTVDDFMNKYFTEED